jgi:hypothetical protein
LARFEKSRETVADFCLAESVSQAAFYLWKRRLGAVPRSKPRKRGRRAADPGHRKHAAFRAVVVTPPEQTAAVKVRLPGGAVMELGRDLPTIQQVVGLLLEHQAAREVDAC